MIFKILFIICVAIFVALTITFFEDLKKSNRKKISFKEALDLTELPIVTFIGKGRKLNFLIDTGANNRVTNLVIKFDDKREYDECFLISNMDDAFNSIKSETGVMIHGILGSNFFAKYKYIINYDSLALYVK